MTAPWWRGNVTRVTFAGHPVAGLLRGARASPGRNLPGTAIRVCPDRNVREEAVSRKKNNNTPTGDVNMTAPWWFGNLTHESRRPP